MKKAMGNGAVLLVGIAYDKIKKIHHCRIEKYDREAEALYKSSLPAKES